MATGKIQVLLIEDRDGDARLLKEMLADDLGHTIQLDWVKNLTDGIEKLGECRHHLMLLDLGLPECKGLETLDRMLSVTTRIPIIVLTGLDDEDTGLEAVRKGAHDYLVKGNIDGSLLIRAIKYAIIKKSAEDKLSCALYESKSRQIELTGMLESLKAVLENTEFRSAARAIFDNCKELVGAKAGYMALLSRGGEESEVLVLDTGGMPCSVDSKLPIHVRSLRGKAITERKAKYYNDFKSSKWAGFMPEGHGKLKNLLFAPLIVGGEGVGIIGLANKPGGFSENDARLALAFSDLTSLALLNYSAVDALVESEKDKTTILDAMSELIVYRNRDMETVWASQSAADWHGLTTEEMKGRICHKERYGRDAPCKDCYIANAANAGETRTLETTSPDGKHWDVTVNPVTDDAGRVIGTVEVSLDITAKKRAEKELVESETRLRQIIENYADGILITDDEGIIRFINPAAEKLFGDSSEKLVGTPFGEAIVSGKNSQIDIFRSGKSVIAELRTQEIVWDGKEMMLTALRDVTERQSMQEELAQSRKMASVGRLAAGVAHEVNTPLANIEFLVANVKKRVNDPYILEKLKRIETQTHQAGVIVKDLLSFSRRAVPIPAKTDISKLISTMCRERLEKHPEETIELSREVEKLPTIMADQRLLGQVFNNMIDNAIDAMPDGGRLAISARQEDDDWICISFRDSGAGIQKENLDKIFDPFFTTKIGTKGTGLGLSICHGIVEAHSGRITVESVSGEGTCFRIILPVVWGEVGGQKT